MAETTAPPRPSLNTKDTLESPSLLGTLNCDGIAALRQDQSSRVNGHATRPANTTDKDTDTDTDTRDFGDDGSARGEDGGDDEEEGSSGAGGLGVR